MRNLLSEHRRAVGLGGAGIALGMAVLWTVVVPDKAEQVDGVQEVAIRWGHPLCWALLAITGVLYAVRAPKATVAAAAWAALACYAAFLVATLW